MPKRKSFQGRALVAVAALVAAGSFTQTDARACPFCAAVDQTLSEELAATDVAIIARLMEGATEVASPIEGRRPISKARFRLEHVIKGANHLPGNIIETIYFGQSEPGRRFLITGVDPPQLVWGSPLPLSDAAVDYLLQLPELPESGADRLAFFQQYFEHPDDLLAGDTYDEFARATYDEVKALKPRLDREQLVIWINDPDVPASRRRLYFTLLGVCGTSQDIGFLEGLLTAPEREKRAGLDALVGCYLTLNGEKGLPLIEELYFMNEDSEYSETYSVIMALRFHEAEGGVLSRDRILESFHLLLDRPQIADLIIPDLARWEDWSQVDRLVQLFKDADESNNFVREPVVRYLIQCPLPRAEELIAELEAIDPDAVRRARTFFPYGGGSSPVGDDDGDEGSGDDGSGDEGSGDDSREEEDDGDDR